MKKSGICLAVVGMALLSIGIIFANQAPVGAMDDVSAFMGQPDHVTGSKRLLIRHQLAFYEANLTKRFLTSALIGVSGCGLLILGAARLTEEPQTEQDSGGNG